MQAIANVKQKLNGLLGRFQQPVLGIDIGSHSVKLVALKLGGDSIVVLAACHMPLPEGAVSGHKIKDPIAVANVVQTLVQRAGVKAKTAVVALPTSEAIIKTIRLDIEFAEADHAAIEQQLIAEMASQVSFPLEQIRLDYQFLSSEPDHEQISVLTVATRADTVVNYQTILAQAGLEPVCLEVEQYAVARSYPYLDLSAFANKSNLCLAMLDFGANYASITVVEGEEVLYADEQRLRLSGTAQSILQWSERALTLFYTSGLRTEVDGIMLMGSNFPEANDLLVSLKAALNLPVVWANPFAYMTMLKPIEGNAQSYLLSCGLALRGLQHD